MKQHYLILVLGFAANWLVGDLPCFAHDPAANLDSLLAKWEAASQKCRSLDAKVTRIRYSGRGDRPTIAKGRFYYEAPNLGCFDITERSAGTPSDSSRIVWKGGETLWINEDAQTCLKFSVAKLGELTKPPRAPTGDTPSGSLSFFAGTYDELWGGSHDLWKVLYDPRIALPLVIDIRSPEVDQRYSLSLVRGGEEIRLKAVSKLPSGRADYGEIDVILNAKTYMTYAIRMALPDSQQQVVFILDDQKINQRPSDREKLLNPDLSGLRVRNGDL
jgi:hypothetical protein